MKKLRPYAPTNKNWNNFNYPFDSAACGICVTQHAYAIQDCPCTCTCTQHEKLRVAAKKAFPSIVPNPPTSWLKKRYKRILTLRKKFAACWT